MANLMDQCECGHLLKQHHDSMSLFPGECEAFCGCTRYVLEKPWAEPVEIDVIKSPSHYTHGTIEVWDVIRDWDLNYFLGNVVKYVARCDHKDKPIQDLEKAVAYLEQEIAHRKGLSETNAA